MVEKMSLWKNYEAENLKLEYDFPASFPWNSHDVQDKARYVKGEDGYWYSPSHRNIGKALLSLTGDLMCEPDMCRKNRYGDTWFFHSCFQYVRKIFRESDLSVGNLETTVTDLTPYAGEYHVIPNGERNLYHCNAPESYLDSLRYAGFDVLVNANNHNCDSGVMGLKDTLSKIDAHGFMRTGTFLEDDGRVLLVKVNGIKIAILSYASHFNGMHRRWTDVAVNSMLNPFDFEKAKSDVEFAKSQGAEFVISYIHWGVDYALEPDERQMTALRELAETGVDYIVGSHTHCIQRFDSVTNSQGKVIPVIFSMGNFITNEARDLCRHTGVLQLILNRTDNGIAVREYFLPCYVFDEMGSGKYTVVPTDTYYGGVDCEKLREAREYIRERLESDIPEPVTSKLSLAELCREIGTELPDGAEYIPVSKLCFHPWNASEGCVYFANGNETPLEKGKVSRSYPSAVVSREPWDGVTNILSDNPIAAYEKASAFLRKRFTTPIILIAGGYGKTELREKIVYCLESRYSVLTQQDKFQVDTNIWQNLHPYHDFCVMEIHSDYPADLLSRVIKPEMCILTGRVSENQEENDRYAKALAEGMSKDGIMFYNCDDLIVNAAVEKLDCNKSPYTFGNFAKVVNIPIDSLYGIKNNSLNKNIFDVDGIRLVVDVRAKIKTDVIETIDKAAENGGFIAVLGTPDIEKCDLSDYAYEKGAKLVISADLLEREIEKILLDNIKEEDTVLVCGGRRDNLNMTLRRVFGINDRYIKDAR